LTIESGLVSLLKSFGAVTAIVGAGTTAKIRPYKLWQKDALPAVIVAVNSEEPDNDLSHHGGLVKADVSVIACAAEMIDARALAAACRTNSTSNPGEGLEGFSGLVGDVTINSIASGTRMPNFISFGDDSDEGYYVVDAHYTVIYQESI
jgi:hypothetical protein